MSTAKYYYWLNVLDHNWPGPGRSACPKAHAGGSDYDEIEHTAKPAECLPAPARCFLA